MSRPFIHALVAAGVVAGWPPAGLSAQRGADVRAVRTAGVGTETFVLISGLVGGVAGFRRLEAHLVEQDRRVIVIDPYLLSIDSAAVSFAALARPHEEAPAELTSILLGARSQVVASRMGVVQ